MKVQYKGKKKEVLINKDMDKETIEEITMKQESPPLVGGVLQI